MKPLKAFQEVEDSQIRMILLSRFEPEYENSEKDSSNIFEAIINGFDWDGEHEIWSAVYENRDLELCRVLANS